MAAHRTHKLRRQVAALLGVAGFVLLGLGVVAPAASAGPGDVAIDLAAAKPTTYDHADGTGGAYVDGSNTYVVESLEGGDFACGEYVVQFAAVTVGSESTATSIEIDFEFLAETTGQPGAFFTTPITATLNAGDPFNSLSGGETVTNTTPTLVDRPSQDVLATTVTVTGLAPGEQLVVRTVAKLGCIPDSDPTGNLQTAIVAARVTAPAASTINVGNQTIPFKVQGFVIPPPEPASLTIVKDVAGGENAQDFGFTAASPLSPASFTLDDDTGSATPTNSQAFTALDPGTYTVTEGTLPSNWALTSVACTEGNQTFPSDRDGQELTVTLAEGDDVTCTFLNTYTPPIIPPDINVLPPDLDIAIAKSGPVLAHVGDTVTYTMVVTNTGDADLVTVVVSDPSCDAGTLERVSGDEVLNVGESWSYRCSRLVEATDPDPLPNRADVAGTAADGRSTTDSDAHSVDLIHPAVTIVKTASAASVTIGDDVTFTYVVTNTGDTTLFDLAVVDDELGVIGELDELAAGATHTFTRTITVAGDTPTTNVGEVTGTDVLGTTVSDDDDETIGVVAPQVITTKPTVAGVKVVRELPRTGAETGVALQAAGMALLLGAALVLAGDRMGAATRRRTS